MNNEFRHFFTNNHRNKNIMTLKVSKNKGIDVNSQNQTAVDT